MPNYIVDSQHSGLRRKANVNLLEVKTVYVMQKAFVSQTLVVTNFTTEFPDLVRKRPLDTFLPLTNSNFSYHPDFFCSVTLSAS